MEYIVISIILGACSVLLGSLLIIKRRQNKIMLERIVGLEIENYDLKKAVQVFIDEQQSKEIEQSDGFLKFISDSRDWAFDYIEKIQDALLLFDNKITTIIDKHSTYDSVESVYYADIIKQFSEAYRDLKSLLPQEDGKV